MELLNHEELSNAITVKKTNWEVDKQSKLAELRLAKEETTSQFAGASQEDVPVLINQLLELEKQIVEVNATQPEDIKPINCVLFDGKLYKTQKNTTDRTKSVGRFQIGSKVKLSYQGIEDDKIYRVAEGSKVIDESDNKQYAPSVLTELFHVEKLNRAPSNKGMAGLSHPYWIQAE